MMFDLGPWKTLGGETSAEHEAKLDLLDKEISAFAKTCRSAAKKTIDKAITDRICPTCSLPERTDNPGNCDCPLKKTAPIIICKGQQFKQTQEGD